MQQPPQRHLRRGHAACAAELLQHIYNAEIGPNCFGLKTGERWSIVIMLIENGGVIIRVPASDINVYKRDVQGVIVMRIEEGNQLVAIERIEKDEEEAQ